MMAEPIEVELLVDARAIVGEGPIWDPRDNRLIWVDIMGHKVHRYDPASGQDEAFDVGQPVGAAATRASGGLVLAVHDGFATLDLATGRVELLAPVEQDIPHNRMNDGRVDSAGRFWAGTMPYEWQERVGQGALYRLNADHTVERIFGGVTISNGIDWSPDDRLMYYVDSPTQRMEVFDYDAASGAISNRRTLVEIPSEVGLPDGLTVDAEGYIWLAVWGGWRIQRYSPDGRLDREVRLPVSQGSSCCFGGPDLMDLYITSATSGLAEAQLRQEPHAGALWRCRPGVKGKAPHSYKG